MGCHTWFYRPVTKEEFNIFKENALEHAWYLHGNTEFNRDYDFVNLDKFKEIRESVENNTDAWWKEGYGTIININTDNEKSESTIVLGNTMYLDLAGGNKRIFELQRYHDVFRVKHYPSKKIHSRRELRRWMGKRYFDLTNEQLETISKFFRENKGGFICFG